MIEQLQHASADTGALRGRLAAAAEAEGLVDVAYREIASPIGGLLLAATTSGLVYVAFEVEDRPDVLDMLATRIGPRVLQVPAADSAAASSADAVPGAGDAAAGAGRAGILDAAADQIEQYLAGTRRDFDLPLDTRLATGFRGEVQRHLVDVSYGRTATYKQLAAELSRPGAVRAVGTACATNPLPLVWPCHRILRTDGGLGGYRGGIEAKQRLLAMESAA
ncbi:methylated-DNA--protein-cysteine methyltransferase [Dietzia sp. NCCP-2495]|uniref:methylated-DNA--[protein]-cysteine S-methyltransferase n=1 Tax=Dietzia sp. NCCP-2495 TaxID=2934675 RepID=UPI0022314C7F|nr:methylated-DNA--[protein]-cysteine S-methyltransferase [Dietzia sp. NCCP-2495]GLB65170.1 methylated-DNA--protein-cysteine methyltransferase [Dietzia sp. NCCP-2495]